jgi:adenosylmethionine---8-amino-7-oxononanoate aminotransferase
MFESREELLRWDREIVWHAFTQMAEYEPLLIQRAHGCWLVDVDGREYLDGVSSLWCNVHGHGHPRLNRAIQQQLNLVAHVTSLGMSNPTTVRLAKRLVDLAPDGLGHVFFSSDGSSAIEVALKMAFQYWRQCRDPHPQKTKYVAFGDAYHGDTLGSVSVGGVDRFNELFRPLLFDVIRLPSPTCYRLPAGVTRDTACGYYLAQLEACLQERHHEIAAVIIEPLVQGAAGMVVHPEGLLAGIRRLTERYGVLLIADEVAVGFGRTGKMFACEHERVTPDLLCLGKGLTGGYLPMAATLTTGDVWQAFLGSYAEAKTFFHGHTYGGNPVAAAVALASLDVFDEERTLEQLPAKVDRLAEHLARIARLQHVGDVRQCGLMAGVELVQDRDSAEPYPWHEQRGIGPAITPCSKASGCGRWAT